MNLSKKIAQQRSVVQEFESAIEDIKSPPKYPPSSPSEPLVYLQNLLTTAADDRDRAEKLQAAQNALNHSRQVLAELEAEQAAIDTAAAAQAARAELEAIAQQFNHLSDQMAETAAKLLETEEALRTALAAERAIANPSGRELLNALSIASIELDGLKISPRSQPVWKRSSSPFA